VNTKRPTDSIPIYQVDAFTDEPFRGNPAGVCILREKLDDAKMQSIAAEMNLSETAFALPLEGGPLKSVRNFSLRWFTPSVEVPLCGHATLATAAVLFSDIGIDEDPVTGSAHTVLAPYWSRISGKKEMAARQASARGGILTVRLCDNDRVALIGNAVIVLKGELFL